MEYSHVRFSNRLWRGRAQDLWSTQTSVLSPRDARRPRRVWDHALATRASASLRARSRSTSERCNLRPVGRRLRPLISLTVQALPSNRLRPALSRAGRSAPVPVVRSAARPASAAPACSGVIAVLTALGLCSRATQDFADKLCLGERVSLLRFHGEPIVRGSELALE